MGRDDLPDLALSVRQPWAWAIIQGGKDIENRTAGAIRAGRMDRRRIALHAASGMSEREYRWAVWKLQAVGVRPPRPDALARGAIIGAVDVVDIVDRCDSPWFGGPCGLVLRNPSAVDPIPAKGALGYFAWAAGGRLAPVKPWMRAYDRPNDDARTLSLFGDLDASFATPPERPGVRKPPVR